MSEEIIYSWSFSNKKDRSNSRYIIALSIVIWIVIWWFLTKQYGMSFIILLISWLFYFLENNTDENIKIEINNLWIKIWNWFYDFSKIRSYSVLYSWERAQLLRLNLNQKWLRNIDLIIDNKVALDLKSVLPNFIEENKESEMWVSDKIIKYLKL